MPKRILIAGGSGPLIETAVDTLQDRGYSFMQLDTAERAVETLARRFFPIVIIDMPGIDTGRVAARMKDISPLSVIAAPLQPGSAPGLRSALSEQEAMSFIDSREPFAITGSLSIEQLASLVEKDRRYRKMRNSRSVLFVDDNVSVLQSYTPLLTEEGYKVTGVSTGREAIDAVRRDFFGLVILDYKLPDMSGVEISRRLRQIDADTSLIFMTAFADLDIVLEALKEQAADFLIKPIDPEKLCATLKKVSALLSQKGE